MTYRRLLIVATLVVLALPIVAGPAGAWEINLKGFYNWQYDYISQRGHQGFFGAYDTAMPAGFPVLGGGGTFPAPFNRIVDGVGTWAPLNGWLGERWPVGIVSGSDSSWQTVYMDVDIELKINPAIKVTGLYHVGEWLDQNGDGITGLGNLVNSESLSYRYGGIRRSFSPGYWNLLYMTVDVPWGTISFGKRPSVFGLGLGYWNGTDSQSTESLQMAVPFGPFRIGSGFYPSRRSTAPSDTIIASVPGPPYYNEDWDKNNTRIWDLSPLGLITYRQGCFETGVRLNWIHRHRGGEGILALPTTRAGWPSRDQTEWYAAVYFKYFNGRFFANSEVDTYQQAINLTRKTPAGAPLFGARNTYVENWRWMMELGAVSGPAKVSLVYAWLEGDDRRGGQFNGTSAAAPTQDPLYVDYIDRRGTLRTSTGSNTGVFRPYSYLMVYRYGLGMFVNSDTGNGYAEDASIWAARVDYSVAANLNFFGTFFWADRASKSGFGWGCIRPDLAVLRNNGNVSNGYPSPNPLNPDQALAAATYVPNGIFGVWRQGVDRPGFATAAGSLGAPPFRGGAPNIPDTALGWEVDAGLSWALLEGLTMDFTFAYWTPGNWFKWACVDKRVPNWYMVGVVGSTLPSNWGIIPDKNIDPIYGVEVVIRGRF